MEGGIQKPGECVDLSYLQGQCDDDFCPCYCTIIIFPFWHSHREEQNRKDNVFDVEPAFLPAQSYCHNLQNTWRIELLMLHLKVTDHL